MVKVTKEEAEKLIGTDNFECIKDFNTFIFDTYKKKIIAYNVPQKSKD